MEKGRKKIHYAWFHPAGCCIMQGASLGLINNCSGVFYSPVCQDLGFEMGKFTLYRMLYSISLLWSFHLWRRASRSWTCVRSSARRQWCSASPIWPWGPSQSCGSGMRPV